MRRVEHVALEGHIIGTVNEKGFYHYAGILDLTCRSNVSTNSFFLRRLSWAEI